MTDTELKARDTLIRLGREKDLLDNLTAYIWEVQRQLRDMKSPILDKDYEYGDELMNLDDLLEELDDNLDKYDAAISLEASRQTRHIKNGRKKAVPFITERLIVR